ncbi:HNH endonuclease signature motif containing protein [Cellulosilyticum ruminicola]|uniref:HNH endonuclease signature motif containing protein n=1 Tax=Cellulosilyticum ruminicola TaxID=425254 RepID=UPI0012EDC81E|nr:HNH endonuclease signature motif containing protein [Cellulosilyticum ruminicola]
MECHHILPRHKDGTDKYQNLVWITSNVHKLIHATKEESINKYLEILVTVQPLAE